MDESGDSRASPVPCCFQSFPEGPAEPLHRRGTRLQPVFQLQGVEPYETAFDLRHVRLRHTRSAGEPTLRQLRFLPCLDKQVEQDPQAPDVEMQLIIRTPPAEGEVTRSPEFAG